MHLNTPSPFPPYAGWGFGPIEGAAQCPHDSRAASGILGHFFLRLIVDTGSAIALKLTDTRSLHSRPELVCLLMPSASRAQMRR